MLTYKHTKVGNVETYVFNEEIIPKFLKYQGDIKKIVKIPNDFFVIKEWRVKVFNNVLVELTILDSFHPNASNEPNATSGVQLDFNYPPALSYFCLPESLKNKNLGENYDINHYTTLFMNLLREYNYDSCYWTRFEGFEFVEYQKIIDNATKLPSTKRQTKKQATFSETMMLGIETAVGSFKEEGIKALGSATKTFMNSSVARIPKSKYEAGKQFDYFLNVLEDTLLKELQQGGENAKREQEG